MTGEADVDEVLFSDVSLPADCLIGPLHRVWSVGMAMLASERGHIGTSVIGLERRPTTWHTSPKVVTSPRSRSSR